MHLAAMAFGNAVASVKDFIAIAGQMLEAAQMEIAYLIPSSVLSHASQYAFARERVKTYNERWTRTMHYEYLILLR
jgi:hypothetical protein